MAESNAEVFYHSLPNDNADAFAFLSALPNDPNAEENLWRDYKSATDENGNGLPEEKLKEIWSENLSAFGNTDGGVLIFGFRSRKKFPGAIALVPDAQTTKDKLLNWVNNATDPFVGKVEARAIVNPANALAGFIVALIPQGIFRPHRAVWGERTFFQRNQESNFPIPASHLRMMFHPQPKARLRINLEVTVSKLPDKRSITVVAKLVNRGPATAENVVVVLNASGLRDPTFQRGGEWSSVGGMSNFCRYPHPIPPHLILPEGFTIYGEQVGDVTIEVRMFAHNMPLQYVIKPLAEDFLLAVEKSNNATVLGEDSEIWAPT